MNYKIEYKGEIIAEFKELPDAEAFLEYKRNEIYHSRNSAILDRIAEENNLDRNYPGTFSNDIVMQYYKAEKEKIKEECKLI